MTRGRARLGARFALPGLLTVLFSSAEAAAADELVFGKVTLLRLAGADVRPLRVRLPPGSLARVRVESRGLPFRIRVQGPDGEYLSADRSVPPGASLCSWISRAGGYYNLLVRADGALGARARLELAPLRPAGAAEARWVDAERDLEERAQAEGASAAEVEQILAGSLSMADAGGPCEATITERRVAGLKRDRGELGEAARILERAVQDGARCGVRRLEALSLLELAFTQVLGGRYDASASALDRASRIVPIRDPDLAADIELARAQLETNRLRASIATGHYERARSRYRQNSDVAGEGRTLLWMAYNHIVAGAPEKALDAGQAALKLWDAIGDRQWRGRALQALGLASQTLGRTARALELYLEARRTLSSKPDASELAVIANGLAELYLETGSLDPALEFAREGVDLNKDNPSGRAESLCLLGRTYLARGQTGEAEEYSRLSLAIYKEVGDPRRTAIEKWHWASALKAGGRLATAIPLLRDALAVLHRSGATYQEALILSSLGEGLADQGSLPEAITCLERALSLQHRVGSAPDEVLTLANLAKLRARAGELEAALAESTRAMASAEALRAALASYELRTSYYSSVSDFQEFHIDLLMRLHEREPARGYDVRALQASELARARTLTELLADTGLRAAPAAESDQLAREDRDLAARVEGLARRIASRTDAEEEEIQQLVGLYTRLSAERDQIQSALRNSDRRYAALSPPEAMPIAELQASVLDEDTALVEYFLGKERSFVWVVTKDGLSSFVLPGREAIVSLVSRVDELVFAPLVREGEGADAYFARVEAAKPLLEREARLLGDVLLSPFIDRLRERRILLVAHESLHHVPFAALPRGPEGRSRPLLATHEIVRVPSAATLSLLRREAGGRFPPPESVLVVADPVFSASDPRVRRTEPGTDLGGRTTGPPGAALALYRSRRGSFDVANLPRLPASGDEAREILRIAGEERVTVLSAFAARRESVLGAWTHGPGIVHLASHSLVDTAHPELSAIVLSMVDEDGVPMDGLLLLRDIYETKLSAELVVLSACDTALGKEIRGEGILGLTRGFFHAGARRVIASLWKVDDRATRELMRRLYEGIFRDGLAPGAALRQAQLAMSADPRWMFPFYWSGFELHGEWR
jgi:CHAT domain-containing protein/tetratricopeptide (TPR) repeat protein